MAMNVSELQAVGWANSVSKVIFSDYKLKKRCGLTFHDQASQVCM